MTSLLNLSGEFEPPPLPENLTLESPPAYLYLPCRPGRLRLLRHLVLMGPVAAAGWAWFGWTGSVPLLLWWWHRRPRAPAAAWHVDLSQVCRARLAPWRLRLLFADREPMEIFSDELSPCDLARLRREVKYQLATGCSTSNRSGEPGNRIVSSPRVKVSGQSRL